MQAIKSVCFFRQVGISRGSSHLLLHVLLGENKELLLCGEICVLRANSKELEICFLSELLMMLVGGLPVIIKEENRLFSACYKNVHVL